MILPASLIAAKAELDALRPIRGPSLAAIERWADVELTWTSNAIEGSTLTHSETAAILEKGITVAGKPLRDHLDAIGHSDALSFVRVLAAAGEPLREGDVREIHRLVLARSDPEGAGRYATTGRVVLGSAVRFPPPAEIPPLMADFARWMSAAPADPATAFEAHYRLVTIHPFADGNGRTARLLMNLLLFRAGYPPVAIGPEHRVRYLDALAARQSGGHVAAWEALMIERLGAALDRYLAHLRQG